MSQTIDDRTDTLNWMTAADMAQAGFVARGPEIDYGMRWGRAESVRVSFAPSDQYGNGFLYVHDKERRRFAVLVPKTTFADVDAAWRAMLNRPVEANDYLAMADLIASPVPVGQARTIWQHCIGQELEAQHLHETASLDAPDRFELARAVVVARAARVASEQLVATALAGVDTSGYGPAVVHYRIVGRDGWTGQAAGLTLADAARAAASIHDAAAGQGFAMQATSFRHGHVVLSAGRVPEIAGLADANPQLDRPISI